MTAMKNQNMNVMTIEINRVCPLIDKIQTKLYGLLVLK